MVRLALPDDLPALHALVESAYRGGSARGGWTHEADLLEGQRTSQAELARVLGDTGSRMLVMESDGALIGTVTVTRRADGMAYMSMLCVDPALQAGGMGRALIAAAEDCARRDFGATVMEMTVVAPRTELVAYYERRGYAQTGEIRPFPLPQFDHLTMVVLTKALG
ncbi:MULTISPECIES: GNAT family N-acetyltransferase [unclassified Novosphingobium]|uniref:GNAT family N-acetyltransferase n=1 Tax=unclassified Novosphingobium TaxID=2644732 RepID=UPI00086A32A3|nr:MULTISPECIES: GNAT family N-acetyltransferase [unclassified Novosphingobium]MBN9144873.1 GNAT family N-acetyltransferase [Novosphingobium sp.]MDR6708032.1 GNAT superfamily N-acetyltransferase [Novosphingobium sp. 1748]NKJ00529.1 GNAT superfamily N-acetyltransferase [Novosphingobium sp. SG707]ODU82506.1 MAG: GNAT family N-acetyltransferase [Novosphingobium sp. SCN 63-17]OJX92210.1 MAG: GNAT family N-acetyltransferase [Novosphingobium sp. 63-713]